MPPDDSLQERKQQLRAEAHARRAALVDKDALSQSICQRLMALVEFEDAKSMLIYLDVRDEVRTRPQLAGWLASGKQIVVPKADAGRLGLVRLENEAELLPGRYGILEPNLTGDELDRRTVSLDEIDLLIVPGVAFDRRGGRLGHGLGYYDKLLASARSFAPLVGLAFECQMFDEVPLEPHDVPVDVIVTEAAVYRVEQAS